MKKRDYLTKKKINDSVTQLVEMNDLCSRFITDHLEKFDEMFDDDDKENLNNFKRYLDDSLTPFLDKLRPK